ncbi:MAG: hypothetical protein LBD46_08225 [Endomicrobium sp.]|jgi:hypothetical protein|nr:hypothetical protein [Endomicrobium sp.]
MDNFTVSADKKTVFIMGAGASKDDGIAVQNEILDKIVKGNFSFPPDKKDSVTFKEYTRISSNINELVNSVFAKDACKTLSLESLFNILETALDKRENIGNIDIKKIRAYYADLIRGIMYATRIDSTLEEHKVENFIDGKKQPKSPYTEMGIKIYGNYDYENINFSFVNFNYDICLDRVLLSMHKKDETKSFDLDYGIELGNYTLEAGRKLWFAKPRKRKVYLLRPHGSVNWLFCRSCGNVFSKLTRQNKVADILQNTKCYNCGLSNLEPYIIYPSYNRIYENKHLVQIWMRLEKLLMEADKWCFIGYSLPEADRYFTYILTRAYNYRKAMGKNTEIFVVNINKTCGRDIFAKFGTYFNKVIKYECSFKEFTYKYFSVD